MHPISTVYDIFLVLSPAGNKDTEAIDAIIDTMLEKGVDTFFPQALSNVMWSCATLEHTNERFLQVPHLPQHLAPPQGLLSQRQWPAASPAAWLL